MRNRWFHTPELHTEHGPHKRVTWLELFYDLIFVASIIQLGDALSSAVAAKEVAWGLVSFAGHFVPLWLAWTGFTFYANRFDVDDFVHRLLVLAHMAAVGAMGVAAPMAMLAGRKGTASPVGHAAIDGLFAADGVFAAAATGPVAEVAADPRPFALAFAAAQLITAVMYARSYTHNALSRAYSRYWGAVFAAGGVVWLTSALVPFPWVYLVWSAGAAMVIVGPMSAVSRELAASFPLDMEHLSERYGLLTIIVLGESFVKVLSYLAADGHGMELEMLGKGFFSLLITSAVWWVYFDDIAGAELKRGRNTWLVWLYGHLPLAAAVTAVGVAVKYDVTLTWSEPIDAQYGMLLVSTLAATFLSVALIDKVTERSTSQLDERWRIRMRLGSVGVLVLLGVVGGSMSAGWFLGWVTLICIAQVAFDMAMAPLETHEAHDEMSTAEVARQRRSGRLVDHPAGGPARKQLDRLQLAVHRGAPSELRRDLYFWLMEGSWTRLAMTFGGGFLVTNAVFAALYLLQPDAILGTGEVDFLDAFSFSVQTLATIGYGAMSPGTPYANLVVTAEAAVGIFGVALATGLMFAKASRPTANVLYSAPLVLTTWNGKPTLILRVGNARGNEIVDATMHLSVLVDEVTSEGHHLRKVVDLELERSRQPLFMLTWMVRHTIDERSPLHGIDWAHPERELIGVVSTMKGYDATYAQEVHTRHMWTAHDIRVGHRFVDVIGQLPDGRMVVDYHKFHDTMADEQAVAALAEADEADRLAQDDGAA